MSTKIPLIKKANLEKSYIVGIEGLNGVGKTTLTRNIQNNNANIKCNLCVPELFTKNKEIKSFMLFEAAATTSALYYLSGICEAYHLVENKSYSNIVLDRSIWSTFAAAYSKRPEFVNDLLRAVDALKIHLIIPDKIIVLLASFEICQQRIINKNSGKEFDKDTKEIFEKKQDFYRILEDSGYDIRFIDTETKTPKDVYDEFKHLEDIKLF